MGNLDSDDIKKQLDELHNEVQYLKEVQSQQIRRIYELERLAGTPPGTAPTPVPGESQTPPPRAKSVPWGQVRKPAPAAATGAASLPAAPVPVVSNEQKTIDLENRIGGSWMSRIGITALFIALAFFIKYAFDQGWVNEIMRIAMGTLMGLVLLSLGEYFDSKRKYPIYARILTGGGLAMLYLTSYSAFGFYHLIEQSVAFGLMAFVTLIAVFFALRYKQEEISIIAVIGGYATPLALSTNAGQYDFLLVYYGILTLMFFALNVWKNWSRVMILQVLAAYFLVLPTVPDWDYHSTQFIYFIVLTTALLGIMLYRDWLFLPIIAFIISRFGMYIWDIHYYKYDMLQEYSIYVTVFMLLFHWIFGIRTIIKKEPFKVHGIVLQLLNATVYFATIYGLMVRDHQTWAGYVALGLAIYHLAASYLAAKDELWRWNQIGMSAVFVAVSIPILLDAHWITMGWAVEALVLMFLSMKSSSKLLRAGSYILLLACMVRLIVFDRFAVLTTSPNYMPIFNWRVVAYMSVIIAVSGLLYYIRKYRSVLPEEEQSAVSVILVVLGNVMTLGLLSLELWDFITYHWGYWSASWSGSTDLWMLHQSSLSVLWTIYSLVLIGVGMWKRIAILRFMGIAVFGITIFKVFLVDLSELKQLYRIISFFILGLILLGVSYLYQRFRDRINSFIVS